jgi:hypothetical protein
MKRRIRTHEDDGQTMVEFVLVLPILLVVLFGIVQFGITFKDYLALTDAVRAGARTAAVSGKASNPDQVTIDRVKNAADLTKSKVGVEVDSTYPYSISLLGVVVASGDLTSSTTERVE